MIATKSISLKTQGNTEIIDITSQVEKHLADSGVKNGSVNLFVTGSTAGITTIENEHGLLSDFKEMWERVIPRNMSYKHDSAWDESNGYSHVRASLLGASLVIPFSNGALATGTWQQIVLIDFDIRPRSRKVVVQIMGE